MTALVEFLLARIADDEAAAREMLDNEAWVADCNSPHDARIECHRRAPGTGYPETWWLFDGHRLLAECAAKREIMEFAQQCEADKARWGSDAGMALRFGSVSACLRLLALPYADHADWREEWRP